MGNALVTGANRGIGLELCKQLATRGDHVVAAVRHRSDALEATGAEVIEGVDVTDDRAARRLNEGLQGRTLDLLINNAGILRHESLEHMDLASIREQLEANAIGPLRITTALLPYLKEGAKIGLITSRMGSIADNGSGGAYGYRMSKAALNAAGVSLAHDLRPRGIAVAILHPGFVRTDMTRGAGQVEPADAARMLLERLDALTVDTSGTFWHANGQVLPW